MSEQVFVNRILNMKRIKYLGLDMDHTLIRYETKRFESLVYQYVLESLIVDKAYPLMVRQLKFDFDSVIRGLVVDAKNGNILKLSRDGGIRQSCHGTKIMAFAEQKKFYRGTYVDLNDPNYMAIDTSFSIAFCCLFGQLVDLKEEDPKSFPSYSVIAQDVLQSVDKVHAAGDLKKEIAGQLDHYVLKDEVVVAGLKQYIKHGKKIFIVTNSDYAYTRLLLDYAITPFLAPGERWTDLFECVITLADKPRFFYDNLRFLRIDPQTGAMTNCSGSITPGVYQGGSATKFAASLNLTGDEILYVGDHIYGDILRLHKDCNWRTALVVDELGAEVASQQCAKPIEQEIAEAMEVKIGLEQEILELQTRQADEAVHTYDAPLAALQQQWREVDEGIVGLIEKQRQHFNLKWGRVFRAGAEESYFASQVSRYACIYMEKLADLLNHSPYTYFRAPRRLLPHDL